MTEFEEKDTDFISQDDIDALPLQAEEESIEAESTDVEAEGAEEENTGPEAEGVEEENTGAEAEGVEEESTGVEAVLEDREESSEPETLQSVPETDSDPSPAASRSDDDVDQILDDAGIEEDGDPEISDRVILEDVPVEAEDPPPTTPLRVKKKLLLVAAPVVLSVCGILGYVLFSYLVKSVQPDQPMVKSFRITPNMSENGTDGDTVEGLTEVVDTDEARSVSAAHFVALKRFLVPAPARRKDLTYVTADISIQLTTSAATHLVKEHSAFYRNIIYDVLKQSLVSRDKSKINEISLKIAILKALNSALPERSIKDVIVDTFIMY